MRTTIRQVAKRAQVSPVTVSNILRGVEGCASEITRQRVLQAAEELNYLPVQPPVSQNRANETRVISVVFEHSDITHFFLESETFDGLARGAHTHGYDLLVMLRANSGWQIERPDLRFLDRRSDGFIFATNMSGLWDEAVKTVASHQIPTVTCYRQDVPEGVAYVSMDNDAMMEQAVSYLVERGHSRIAHLAGPQWVFNARMRCDAWKRVMEAKGLDNSSHFILSGLHDGWDIDPVALNSIASLGVTAVICFNDTMALSLHRLATANGLNVPRDLSLIGVDDRAEAEKFGLTTFAQSFSRIGQLAMDAWVECASGKPAAQCHRIAPFQLVERDSVRVL